MYGPQSMTAFITGLGVEGPATYEGSIAFSKAVIGSIGYLPTINQQKVGNNANVNYAYQLGFAVNLTEAQAATLLGQVGKPLSGEQNLYIFDPAVATTNSVNAVHINATMKASGFSLFSFGEGLAAYGNSDQQVAATFGSALALGTSNERTRTYNIVLQATQHAELAFGREDAEGHFSSNPISVI